MKDTSSLERFLRLLPAGLRRQKLLSLLCHLRVVSPLQPLRFNGNAKAWVDLRDAESRATYLARSFWPEFPPMVAAFLRGGGDFFDVGANLGLVTFGVVPLVVGVGAQFHLFEANLRLIPLLQRSAQEWPSERFHIVHGCVTDRPGVSHHLLPDSNWGHGLIADHGDLVANVCLDDHVAMHGIAKIGFMKVDVEGWELHALRGAQRTLGRGLVQAGFVEIAPVALDRAGATATELLELLEGSDFDIYFAGMWEQDDSHDLSWRRVDVNGTLLRFARALPLPASFVQGDVLILHRSTSLADRVRSAFFA